LVVCQVQPVDTDTDTLPGPPLAPTVTSVADSVGVQTTPDCCTPKARPAMVSVAFRADELVLAATA
jgi:hypothetical protein